MMRSSSLLLALVPLALLGGCASDNNGHAGVESANQPVVTRSDRTFDLALQNGVLAPGELQRLDGWLAALQPGQGDRLALDDGDAVIRSQVAKTVSRYGVQVADKPSGPQASPDAVHVTLSNYSAAVPSCPEHAHEASDAFLQTTSANFGCAVNGNLAAMVAQPGDLVQGRADTAGTDTATVAKVIDAYRKATPSGGGGTVIKPESTGGN